MRSNLSKFEAIARDLLVAQDLIDSILKAQRVVLPDGCRTPAEAALGLIQSASDTASTAKRFSYSSTVVTLYGAFEQFLEGLVVDAVTAMTGMLNAYSEVPQVVLKNHASASLDVLTMMQADRYYGELDSQAIVAGLHYANRGLLPVKLNAGVFSQHVANFRWKVICTFLERASFSPAQTLSLDPFNEAMTRRFAEEGNLTFVIDDLALRRNEVSHGWEPSDLLSTELLRAYIDVVEKFAQTLHRVICSDLTRLAVKSAGVALGRPDHVFKHRIAGFESLGAEIKLGDYVAIVNGAGAGTARVESIQIENTEMEVAQTGTSAGLGLSKHLPQTARLFIVPDACGAFT